MHTSTLVDEHVASFEHDGYSILPKIFDNAELVAWRQLHGTLRREAVDGMPTSKFENMCELAPSEMVPAFTQPLVLDILETIMGPFIQLDSLTLAGQSPVPEIDAPSPIEPDDGWHRDRWGQVPLRAFIRPLGVNAICYLQDLDDQVGPLRVISESHRNPVTLSPKERFRPHPDERVLYPRAGDVVMFHNCLLHAGGRNTSSSIRHYVRAYYNLTWMVQTDDFSGPNVQKIARKAAESKDYRMLRLLGRDTHLNERMKCGFVDPDEARWEMWRKEERFSRRQ